MEKRVHTRRVVLCVCVCVCAPVVGRVGRADMSLSRYREIKVIGRGSYGEVTLVKCRDDGKKVCVARCLFWFFTTFN